MPSKMHNVHKAVILCCVSVFSKIDYTGGYAEISHLEQDYCKSLGMTLACLYGNAFLEQVTLENLMIHKFFIFFSKSY